MFRLGPTLTLALGLLVVTGSLSLAYDRITGREFASRSEVIAPHGMAATSHPLVTQIALDVLKDGGTAVDAAIAANAALGLMEPTGSGIGGDLFAIVWDAKTKRLYGLNGSGRSPKSLTREMLVSQGLTKMPSHGPLPVTVPGAVDGWFTLHERFGKLPMKRVLGPAIAYAKEGFPVPELIAYYWARSVNLFGASPDKYPNFVETYTIDGRAPRRGEIFKNPALARTYELLAKKGRAGYYEGEVAKAIESFLRERGGYLTAADLAAHHSEWVDPVSVNYRGYDVWELPPNTQGVAALEALNILEGYDFTKIEFGSADHVHFVAEAIKLAFEDAARYFADPAVAPAPLERLLSKPYAAERRALIDPKRAAKKYEAGGPFGASDTVFLTVADVQGNMISLIQSNYRGMGSGMVPPGLGFMLHDRGELFDLAEGRPNSYAPGKRPFHTIIPGFVTQNDEPFMSFGVMGGSMQPQGHVQVLMNIIDFGMNLQEAGDAPRLRVEGHSESTGERMADGGALFLEAGFATETLRDLAARGHRLSFSRDGYGGYQAIRWDRANRVWIGASESRKDGQAAGY
ncbi:MAG: gamma-glutamyltransferase [Candidatus Latescibacteria bacterium]|nr:gamma-glutamyltransferase [Candidatus Latescibacterota bacterium]